MEPSAFYRQHFALEAPEVDALSFRPFWRIRTRLDDLLHAGAITHREWFAGVMFRVFSETRYGAAYGSTSFDRVGGSPIRDNASARRIDAGDRLNRVRAELGPDRIRLLEAHIVADANWRDIAEIWHVHPNTVRKWTIAALKALAEVMWTR